MTRAEIETWFYQHATPDKARDASTAAIAMAGFAVGVGIGAALLAGAWLILGAVT